MSWTFTEIWNSTWLCPKQKSSPHSNQNHSSCMPLSPPNTSHKFQKRRKLSYGRIKQGWQGDKFFGCHGSHGTLSYFISTVVFVGKDCLLNRLLDRKFKKQMKKRWWTALKIMCSIYNIGFLEMAIYCIFCHLSCSAVHITLLFKKNFWFCIFLNI